MARLAQVQEMEVVSVKQARVRILGLTMERVANFRSDPGAKSSGLYAALDRHFDVVGIVRPALSDLQKYWYKLRYFHPDREQWVNRRVLNPIVFKRRTALAETQLQQWQGRYDVIMQLHTLVAPGQRLHDRRYVLHTDNTYLLSERHYRSWAPLRGAARDERVELERTTFQNATFLFPRSEWLRRSLIEDYDCEPARVIRVGGGANVVAQTIAGKRYDGQIALFVGNDWRRKGGETLLKAWEKVQRTLPDAQLWIVGPKRGKEVAEQYAGVKWFGPVHDRTVLMDLYAQATAFVMPSLFEPWGHVFFEAMGFGLPCIGADHCAMPEIIQQNETGLLVPPGEPEPLVDALVALLGDPMAAARMGAAGYRHVQTGHRWDDVVARMAPYIKQAAGVPDLAEV